MAMSPPPTPLAGAASGNGKLTREAVLAVALSMSRLARALDRDPMILYRHAPGKAAPARRRRGDRPAQSGSTPPTPTGAGQPRAVARRYRTLALAHPHVVPLIVTRAAGRSLRAAPSRHLRPLEDILALITHTGFSGPDALHIYRALFGFLHGHVLDELLGSRR